MSRYKHGLRFHPVYSVWSGVKRRCYNKNDQQFKDYGGRGISMCDEWKNHPEVFIRWALENGWQKGLDIDRINNDGDYEPSNCHFTTRRNNSLNQRLIKSNNKSGYRGICWCKRDKLWIARHRRFGKQIFQSYHKDKNDALKARNQFIIDNNLENEYEIQKVKIKF